MSAPAKRRHGLRAFFVLTALLVGAFAYWAYDRYTGFVDTPVSGLEAGDTLVVESGDSFARVLQSLRESGVREGHDLEWQLLARQLEAAGRIQVGEYPLRSEEHTSELQSLMRNSYAVFCLKKQKHTTAGKHH